MKNGAERSVDLLVRAGIDLMITNPGTSEMHMVAALNAEPTIRTVLGLSETVVTGAADGFARVTRRPAATLLHLGPGLANGWANLHNARRARVPIISLVGDHALDHLELDAPLTSDVGALARALGPCHHPKSPSELLSTLQSAIDEAGRAPGQVVNVIVPSDLAWMEGAPDPIQIVNSPGAAWPAEELGRAVRGLVEGQRSALLLGGWAATGSAFEVAAQIAAATESDLLFDTFLPRLDHGVGTPIATRLPYLAAAAATRLEAYDTLVCIGTKVPVPFFAYPDQPNALVADGCQAVVLDGPDIDPLLLLEAVRDELGIAPSQTIPRRPATRDDLASLSGTIDPRSLANAIAHSIKADTVVVDESVSSSGGLLRASVGVPPHWWMHLTGGAIGQGLPLATGVALAAADRHVIAVVGDGSAMYSLPALWTMAREELHVTIVICTNRRYAILDDEWTRTKAASAEQPLPELFALNSPNIKVADIARGFGVPAVEVQGAEELRLAVRRGAAEQGPLLIDAVMYV